MTALFDRLIQASLEGSLLVAGVWVACRLAPSLPVSLRVVLWWLASLKLLVGLAGIDPVPLPILAPAAGTAVEAVRPLAVATRAAALHADSFLSAAVPAPDWRVLAACAWLAMLGVVLVNVLRQRHQTRRLIAGATPADPSVLRVVETLAERVGLTATPEVRRSDRADAPMVAGLLAPIVLLPAERFDALSDDQRQMAICHELMHLRRGDLWLGCLPALAERLFFFHPLAHVAAREYLLAREAACDAAVLAAMNAAPQEYGRLLLTLGVGPLRAGFAASSSSRSFSSLKRRIGMLNHTSPTARARVGGWLLAAATAAAIVPMQLVARTAQPSADQLAKPAAPRAQKPVPAAEKPAVVAEKPAASRRIAEQAPHETGRSSKDDLAFVLLLDDQHTIMSGRVDDAKNAARQLAGARGLWFRRHGQEYVTTDPAAIREAEEIYRPVSEIGAQQGEIGAKQGAIGAQQGEVGAKQGAIGARQGQIGAKQGAIGARQGALGVKESRGVSDAETRELEVEHEKLDKEMAELDQQMKELDEEMNKAGEPMAELDAKMKELDVQMEALDKHMDEANAKADAAIQALVDRLIKNGTAKAVH